MIGCRQILIGVIPRMFFLCLLLLPDLAYGLTISPLRQTITLDHGKKQEISVRLRNEETSEIMVTPMVEAFRLEERTGRPIFGVKDEAIQWVTSTWSNIRLRPGEEREAVFVIQAPANAEPGGHYLGLFLAGAPLGGGLSAGARVGSLLFLYVAGEVSEKLETVQFSSEANWNLYGPVRLTLKLRNSGTIHVIPDGNVTIETRSGRIVAERGINQDRRKVLPGDDWVGEYVFDGLSPSDLGKLTVTARIEYGLGAQKIIERTDFWRLPIVTILILICVAAGAIAAVIARRSRQRGMTNSYEDIS